MKFPTLNILKEIQDRLGPALKELGLKATLGTKNGERSDDPTNIRISFVDPKGKFFSPVEIELAKVSPEEAGITVEGAKLHYFYWEETSFGNGWKVLDCEGVATQILIGGRDALMDSIEAEIRRAKPVPEFTVDGTVSNDKPFSDLYADVLKSAYLYNDFEVTCVQIDGMKSCVFKHDRDGSEWRVALEGQDAILYVEGRRKASCAARSGNDVLKIIYDCWIDQVPKAAPTPR